MAADSIDLGQVIYTAVKPIFKIYFIIAIGYWLAKRNILNVATCRDISDTIVTAILPCLVFQNVVGNLKSSDIKNLGIIFFTAFLLFGFGLLLAFIISIITRSPKRWFGGLLSVGLFPNISDLPIAYVQTLTNGGGIFTSAEGDKGVAYICIFLAAQALVQFSFGLYELVEWDFREELKDEEKHVSKGSSEGKYASNSSSNSPRNSYGVLNNDDSNNNDSNNDDSNNDDSGNSHYNEKNSTTSNSQRPDLDDIQSYNDDLSISSSIEDGELPPPTEIGTGIGSSAYRYHQKHTNSDYETALQSLNRRVSRNRRKDSITTVTSNNLLQPSRSKDLRSLKSQDMHDVINEYSEYDSMREHNNVARIITTGSDAGGSNIVTHTSNTTQLGSRLKALIKKRFIILAKNLISPVSATLIISLAIAMAPPLKALFVKSTFNMPDAPDKLPPLSFVMDITSYIGAAAVPLGLLLLGATIARLQVKTMPKGFWKTAVGIVLARLVILPIIGVGLTTGLDKAGWYEGDKLLRFICVLEYGNPNATSLIYFTAFYTDPNSSEHLQMDCLAACLIFQYAVLFITLPVLISFTIKVSLGY